VVGWVSVVVGVHFLALSVIWRFPLFRYLGAAIALCGATGMAAAAAGATAAVVAGTGGVLPGLLLLTAACWGATRAATSGSTTARGRPGSARSSMAWRKVA
jgi:hypothetical protein